MIISHGDDNVKHNIHYNQVFSALTLNSSSTSPQWRLNCAAIRGAKAGMTNVLPSTEHQSVPHSRNVEVGVTLSLKLFLPLHFFLFYFPHVPFCRLHKSWQGLSAAEHEQTPQATALHRNK